MIKWKKIQKIAASFLVAGMIFVPQGEGEAATRAEIAEITVNREGTDFKYWQENAMPLRKLVEYVRAVTSPDSPDYIPLEDRIAVFDNDGTLQGETTPYYFEWMLYLNRIYNDPSYKPTNELLRRAAIVKKAIAEHNVSAEINQQQSLDAAIVFAGLNDEQYRKVVANVMEQPADGMINLKRGEAFYLPMAEVVSYLAANDFTIYIVSGGVRQIVRATTGGVLPIPCNHIIGNDVVLRAKGQGDIPPEDYLFDAEKDEIITTGIILERCDGVAKAVKIMREVGKKPVLSFGNSMGDASMHQLTKSNKKYRCLVFELLCDDLDREYGNLTKANKIKLACEKYGWIPVSMCKDWKTIYGDNVIKLNKNKG